MDTGIEMSRISLSATQQKVVKHGDGALLVVAGPGSGKTRVLTERIRRLLSSADDQFRVLALTFTNKAASEMKERLAEFPEIEEKAFLGTLHSFCLDVLTTRGAPVGVEGMPHIFESFQDRKQVLLDAAMEDPDLREHLSDSGGPREQDKLIGRWLEMISRAKSRLLTAAAVSDPLESKVYECYDLGLRASKAFDFDDLLLLTYRLFVERPKIADFYRRQYRYIFVDEAQDINEAQYRVLQALCGESYRNVMMVGDPKQAIFMWNGASPKYLDLFVKDFSAQKIELTENFRSSKAVVAAARGLIKTYALEGQLTVPGEVGFFPADDEQAEAEAVVDKIESLKKSGHRDVEGPITNERIALIARNRYVFTAVEKLLAEKKVPFYKKLSAQNESESDLLRDFELCLRLIANPSDRLHLGMLLKRWNIDPDIFVEVGSVFETLAKLTTDPANKALLASLMPLLETSASPKLLDALDLVEELAKKHLDESARALAMQDVAVWRRHWEVYVRSQQGNSQHIGTFLSHVALGTTQQTKHEGIALLTIHSAKGLEFDVVFVMGMTEGTFPDYRAQGAAQEEELRNAFVAVTRSRRLLYLSYPKQKELPWGTRSQTPSRFLRAVGFTPPADSGQ